MVEESILLTFDDPRVKELNFRPYRSTVERVMKRFLPAPEESQETTLMTPWGEVLTLSAGDYLIGEIQAPDDRWPVKKEIFESTYIITRPGFCAKKAVT